MHVEVEKAPQFVDEDPGIAAQQAAALSQSAQLPVPLMPPDPVVPPAPVVPPDPVVPPAPVVPAPPLVPPVAAPVPPLPPLAVWQVGAVAAQAVKSVQVDFARQVLAALTNSDWLVHFSVAQIAVHWAVAVEEAGPPSASVQEKTRSHSRLQTAVVSPLELLPQLWSAQSTKPKAKIERPTTVTVFETV